MARKPLIAPGSILPPQEEAPRDLLTRIVAKDRARRTGEEAPEAPTSEAGIQVPGNTETQAPVELSTQETGNTVDRKPRSTATRKLVETDSREYRKPGTQKTRNTGLQSRGGAAAADAGPAETAEPSDKATFDLPRSLHQRLKVQAAMERRPARAIVIELLTQYLDEHAAF